MNSEAIDILIDDYLDGRLSEEQCLQLEQMLSEDQAVIDRLVAGATLHQLLKHRYVSSTNDDLYALINVVGDPDATDRAVMDLVVEQALASRRRHELEDVANRQLAAQQAEDARNRQLDLLRQDDSKPVGWEIVIPKAFVWLGVAAMLGLVVWIAWPTAVTTPSPRTAVTTPPTRTAEVEPDESPDESPDEPLDNPPVSKPVYVARILDSVGAQWEGLDASTSRLEQDKLFVLREGMAEVTFEDGSTVLIEAPATFQATGPNGMRLVEGRLAAHVPPSGQGFKVVTPQMTVIDLGTEFGVEVDRSTGTAVDVFTGRVIAESSSEADTGRLDLAAGQATRADIGGRLSHVSVADSTQYYRDLTTFAAAPQISGQGVYLRSHPKQVAFQSFESTEHIAVFLERHGVAWQRDWALDEVVGAEPVDGLRVDVYMAHFDPVGDVELVRRDVTRDVVLHFDRPIVGLITSADGLYRTDSTLGHPEVSYPTLDVQKFRLQRGIDKKDDSFVIEDAGRTLRLRMTAGANIDQLRVVLQSESQED